MSDNTEAISITVMIDEKGVPHLSTTGNPDLFTLIAMCDAARTMLMSQYLAVAAQEKARQDQFKPKLLIADRGI